MTSKMTQPVSITVYVHTTKQYAALFIRPFIRSTMALQFVIFFVEVGQFTRLKWAKRNFILRVNTIKMLNL